MASLKEADDCYTTPWDTTRTIIDMGESEGKMVRESRFFRARRQLLELSRHEHMYETFRRLVRADRRKTNPRFIGRFDQNFAAFREWALENGFGLHKQLVLENPRILPNTCVRYEWTTEWRTRRDGSFYYYREREGGFYAFADECFDDASESEWVTDYDLRWVPTRELAKMRGLPMMTTYGRKRVREERARLAGRKAQPAPRKQKRITAFGETKSVSAWSKDARCQVSDKVLARRLDSGWSPEVAIATPPEPAGRPRKRAE